MITAQPLFAPLSLHKTLAGVLLVLLVWSDAVRPDVYSEQPFDPDRLLTLSSLLPKSLRPGGTRDLTVNGSRLLVTRHIVDRREKLSKAMTHDMKARFLAYPERGFNYQELEELIALGEDQGKAKSQEVVEKLVQQEIDRIRTAFELPFSFSAGPWRAIARIPVSAIDPDSLLAETPVTEGYILFAEESKEPRPFYDLWELRFQEGFQLLDVVGGGGGDAVGDDFELVPRLPNSRRTLTYEENADHWYTKTWSYEAGGSVNTAFAYYIEALKDVGFEARLAEASSEAEKLAFLKRNDQEVVVHILDTGEPPLPVQVTIQRYPLQ